MANTPKRSDAEAFAKFMDNLMGGLAGKRPNFSTDRFSGNVDYEGDGYATKRTSAEKKDADYGEEGCNGCSSCSKHDLCTFDESDDLYETEAAGFSEEDDDCESCGETYASITFTVRGPECFAEEISQDVYRLLKGLRGDAMKYAEQMFEDDAEELVSVAVGFSTSTSDA